VFRHAIVGIQPRGIVPAASRVLKHLVLVFCLGEGGVGAGSGAPGDGKCDCFEAFGEVCDGAAGGRLDCFVRRVRCTQGSGPGRSESFQDAELFGCQQCLVFVGRVEVLNGRC